MGSKPEKLIIIGAGLVGSLLSMYLARMGHQVDVYDKNGDLREAAWTTGKSSINLTLCNRGFHALDEVGVGDIVRRMTKPVYGRLIHNLNDDIAFQHYGNDNQALYSILRSDLNRTLLECAAQSYGISFFFNQKCQEIDLATNTVTFKDTQTGAISCKQADRIFGADGAFSAVRSQLQRTDRFNYSQQYMEYGYRELTIPAGKRTGWLAQENVIHFWPRGDFMLMGFSNIDGSFTLSLHMPLQGPASFEAIQTDADLLALFEQSFPDVMPQIPTLVEDFFAHSTNSMLTIRCAPWSFQDKILLIGDSAHAIVPYYGQGANAGFEDCAVLSACIEAFGDDWKLAFSEFERLRRPNTDAIADLALGNFVELRALVADPRFLLRKKVERKVHLKHPDKYVTLYSMIAFSALPYVEALHIDQAQRVLIDQIMNIDGIEQCCEDDIDRIIDDLMQSCAPAT